MSDQARSRRNALLHSAAFALALLTLTGSKCRDAKLGEVRARIDRELAPGMHRTEVETRLRRMNVGFRPVDRRMLELIGEDDAAGVRLGGRLDGSTGYVRDGFTTRRLAIFIELDERDMVARIRTEEIVILP